MRVDENGNAWWHWLLGIVIIVAAVALSVVTSGLITAAFGAVMGTTLIGSVIGGAAASIIGGLITGSVVDGSTALLSFGIGGLANIAAKGISDLILNGKATQIANMSNKAKSLAVQRLEGHSLNMGAQALKGSMRNAFKNITKNEIKILLQNADSWLRLGIYASLFSSFLSSFPFAFK